MCLFEKWYFKQCTFEALLEIASSPCALSERTWQNLLEVLISEISTEVQAKEMKPFWDRLNTGQRRILLEWLSAEDISFPERLQYFEDTKLLDLLAVEIPSHKKVFWKFLYFQGTWGTGKYRRLARRKLGRMSTKASEKIGLDGLLLIYRDGIKTQAIVNAIAENMRNRDFSQMESILSEVPERAVFDQCLNKAHNHDMLSNLLIVSPDKFKKEVHAKLADYHLKLSK